jgi:hypothetical protein
MQGRNVECLNLLPLQAFAPSGRTIFFRNAGAGTYEPGGILPGYLHICCSQIETLAPFGKYHIESCLLPSDAPLATMFVAIRGCKFAYRYRMNGLCVHVTKPSAGISTERTRNQVPMNDGNS